MAYTKPQIERIGTAHLIAELYKEGIKIAFPDIDDGVDLIAYTDSVTTGFRSVPIQIKCFSGSGFSSNKSYLKTPSLKIAYIWNVGKSVGPRFFLMPYESAEEIVSSKKWSRKAGRYARTSSSSVLEAALEEQCPTGTSLKTILFP